MSKEPLIARDFHAEEHLPAQTRSERYTWKMLDKPGEFRLINKNELIIDEAYQRKLSPSKVQRLAREWSWIACGAISVSWREPLNRHLYFVMEGQHRTAAAQRRSDIDALPCLVFQGLTQAEEAAGFVRAQGQRAPLTMAQRHRGSLMAGNHTAVVVEELARSIGRSVAHYTGPQQVNCVSVMLDALEHDEAALRRIFPLVGALCEGNPIPRTLLAGLFYIETHLPPDETLSSNRLRRRLLDRGYNQIMENIAAAIRLRGKGRPSTAAEGILISLNYRMRNHVHLIEE